VALSSWHCLLPLCWLLHYYDGLRGLPQRKYSVCKIDSPDTYEKGRPKLGGLSDTRLGTMDRHGGICTTDGCDSKDSPGYFGHIELAKPMYHVGFIKTVIRVLRCVSYHSSKLLIDKVRCGLLFQGWIFHGVQPLCSKKLRRPHKFSGAVAEVKARIIVAAKQPHVSFFVYFPILDACRREQQKISMWL